MPLKQFEHPYIQSFDDLHHLIAENVVLKGKTVQNLDFRGKQVDWHHAQTEGLVFLGCTFNSLEDELFLRTRGAIIYPPVNHLPYNPYRKTLYTWQELMHGCAENGENSYDWRIYEHFSQERYNPSLNEALNQRVHDHAIEHALREMLEFDDQGMTQRKCVGFMGGHSTLRTDEYFHLTARCAKLAADAGFYVVSGGGPGIMEAANLGGYFGNQPDEALEDALQILAKAPDYKHTGYLKAAREVLEKYPHGNDSLAVPTWFYGHEPSNLFASHIAKLFSNSIREDCLLAVSLYGVVFAPGSAGTTQEIFQDAAQNHYGTFGYYSPMVFLGKKRYEIDTLIYPLLRQLAWDKEYRDMLHISDDPEVIVRFLKENPPQPRADLK